MKARSILSELKPYVPGKRITGGIKLSSNENPLGSSPAAIESIASVLNDVHRYPDGSMHALRTKLADRWGVEENMTVVGNGSDEIMVMIAGAVIEPGTNAITVSQSLS